MRLVDAGPGTRVAYEVVGGDPGPGPADLVLVHGTGGTGRSNFGHLFDALASDGRRLIVVDYAGSGATTDPGGPLEVAGLTSQVLAAARDAGSERFDLLGFSLGAVVAAHLAATSPEVVDRLVLLCGWAAPDARVRLQFDLWRRLHAGDREALVALLMLTGFSPSYLSGRPDEALAQGRRLTLETMPAGFARQCELDARADVSELLGRIRAETLVVGAREDQMVPVEHPRALADGIAHARYAEIDSGHLVTLEAPDRILELVGSFLRR